MSKKNKSDDQEAQRKKEEEAETAWKKAQEDIKRHDEEFDKKHGKGN